MRPILILALATALMAASCANPKDVKWLDDRLTQQEARLNEMDQSLKTRIDRSGQSVRDNQADLSTRVDALQSQLAQISGEIEVVKRSLAARETDSQDASKRLEELDGRVEDIRTAWHMLASELALDITLDSARAERLASRAAQPAPAPPAAPSDNATAAPAPDAAPVPAAAAANATAPNADAGPDVDTEPESAQAQPADTPAPDAAAAAQAPNQPEPDQAGVDPAKALYDRSRSMYENKKYREAQLLWEEFETTYPGHKLVPNAIFWQGESFYQMQNYAEAALKYQDVIDKYPKAIKYPTALLKQGLAFMRLGRIKAGSMLMEDLIRKFPKNWEAKRAKKILENVSKKK